MERTTTPFDPARLGSWLREARDVQGLSQEWVGERAGVTKQAISQFELGTTVPDEATLRKILEALKQPQELADQWAVYRETERLREDMVRRGLASVEDIDLAIRLLRRIQVK